jgi:hypothetical protein
MSNSTTSTCPKPGIYPNVPFDDYLAWDAVSSSRLRLAARSLAHYNAGFTSEPTPAMTLGTLCHAGVLEPLAIAKRFCFMPDYAAHPDNVTAKGERSWSAGTRFVAEMQENFKRLHHDKEIVSEDAYNKMVGIATTLSSCPIMRGLLSAGRSEVSIVWDDPTTGLRCKARCDWLDIGNDRCALLDLKTTADASEFGRSIVRYGYHRQMAHYARGVEVVTGHRPTAYIAAVETSAPFGHMVAPMDGDALESGSREIDELLARVAESIATDTWPSYEHPESWKLPEWYTRKSAEPVELVLEDGEVVVV